MAVCPDGYTYLGEDLPVTSPMAKSWVYEEVDRTDVYRKAFITKNQKGLLKLTNFSTNFCSCYKLVYDDKSNWLDSTHKCWDDEAQLVSLEVQAEMPRVADLRKNSGDLSILTSAMRFSDGWYWVGSSK